MPRRTLDSIQRRPRPRGPKRDQRLSRIVQNAAEAHQQPAFRTPQPSPAMQRRVRSMWLAVGITMVVIIAGWAMLLRTIPAPRAGESAGLFDRIAEKVSSIFSNDTPTQTTNTPTGDTEELRDLRNRVFPELEN